MVCTLPNFTLSFKPTLTQDSSSSWLAILSLNWTFHQLTLDLMRKYLEWRLNTLMLFLKLPRSISSRLLPWPVIYSFWVIVIKDNSVSTIHFHLIKLPDFTLQSIFWKNQISNSWREYWPNSTKNLSKKYKQAKERLHKMLKWSQYQKKIDKVC